MQTERPHIGPDLKRNPIPRDVEWLYNYIVGDLHCTKCGNLIDDNNHEHGDERYSIAQYTLDKIKAHRCGTLRETPTMFEEPAHAEKKHKRKEQYTPKMFG